MTKTLDRRAWACIGLAALSLTAAAVAIGVTTHHNPEPSSLYDQDQMYWIFQNRHGICDDAQALIDAGNTLRDTIDAFVVTYDEADAVTDPDAQQYLRGLLTGCVQW
jgi:hypothetical protein